MNTQSELLPLVNTASVVAAVRAQKYSYHDEAGLQAGVFTALETAGIPARREVRLSVADRVDVFVDGIAIEIKLAGSVTTVLGQLQRYAAYDAVSALVLVTTRARHRALPTGISGKPLTVVQVGGAA